MLRKMLALGAVLLALAAWPTRAQERLVLGFPSAPLTVQFAYLAFGEELGFFRDENIKPEYSLVTGSAVLFPQIATGRVDIGLPNPDFLVIAAAKGEPLPVRFVMNWFRSHGFEFVVLDKSPVRQLSDLKGKKLGVGALTFGNIPLSRAMLASVGVGWRRDIEVLPVGIGPAAWRRLETGEIDALNLFVSQHGAMELAGIPIRRLALPERFRAIFSNGWAASNDLIEKKPRVIEGPSGGPERFRTWLSLTERQLVAYAEATRTAGAWNCPTLVTVDACASVAERGLDALPATARYLAPGLRETMVEGIRRPVFTADVMRTVGEGKLAQLRFLKLLHEAGNRLLAGTDASLLAIVPGFSIHDEMRNFVAAGLTPLEALTCCCRNPALFYGYGDAGRIGPGARADLVLLDADPLRDIAHTRRIAGVMANGRWLPVERLLAMLDGAKPGSVLAGPPPPDGRAGPNAFSHLSAGGHTDAA